ncbi:sodium/proline symporter [Halovivax limisalsi]|uniref:sodium/proline symporter n=1 Tax=Halovivax limisalsi TaxID=1453760 RepID=UPI001FFC7783|nr:sodium/proline symporter [Halovivax limisalsi]
MVESSTITFALYLLVVFGIGIFGYLATNTFEDFALGGRGMKDWVVGLSAQASDMSIWLLIGLPATAYAMGLSAIWIGMGVIAGTAFNWFFLSKRMRRYSGHLESVTVLDFLEKRVRDDLGIIKLVGSVSLVLFYTISTSGEFIGSGKILNAVFGYDFFTGVLIGGVLVLVYTLVGGFIAVSYTDVLQALIMIVAVVLLPVVAFVGIGSVAGGLTELQQVSGASPGLLGGSSGVLAIIGFFAGTIGIGFGYPGQPHITVRYMSIDDHRNLRRASLIGMVWVIFATYGAIFLGWAAGAYLGGVENTDQVMPLLADELLPGWLVGILMAGAIAGMMSTSDSKFLVATNAVSYNLYKRFVNEDASDRTVLWVSRIVMAAIVVAAIALARPSGVVFTVILGGWAGIGASFGPLLIASLYWKRLNKWGAYAGMIVGMATVAIWLFFDIGIVYELIPGFLFSSVAIVAVSLLTAEPPETVQREFEDATGASGLRVEDAGDTGVPGDD